LGEALQRCDAVAEPDHITVIVASGHRRWWLPLLREMPTANVIVQPSNRGTANGILLPLLHIMARDPDARIVLLPSDHYVRDERVLACGWNDRGTPTRLLETLRELPRNTRTDPVSPHAAPLNLSMQHVSNKAQLDQDGDT
jgi:mannose-1-phosphate guanylyltransferase